MYNQFHYLTLNSNARYSAWPYTGISATRKLPVFATPHRAKTTPKQVTYARPAAAAPRCSHPARCQRWDSEHTSLIQGKCHSQGYLTHTEALGYCPRLPFWL